MMKFFSENHSGDVNIDSGRTEILHPFWPGIHIHIASESLFTSLRNDYSHAPESALVEFTGGYLFALISVDQRGDLWVQRFRRLQGLATLFH